MSNTLLETAKQVILIEAHAVTQLAEQLDQGFIDACGLIQNCTGKVVLIGMGKSGHIGKNGCNFCLYWNTCVCRTSW